MEAIASLVTDDPYLTMPISERIAARRFRRAKLFKPTPFVVAPSMPDPPKEPETESVFTISGWIERQKQIPLPPVPAKLFLTVLDIQIVVCKYYGITLANILSASRSHNHVKPRQIAMYLARKLTNKSTLKIGRFCGRDHSTAFYAVTKIERLIKSDLVLAEQIATIRAALLGEVQ